MKKVIVLTILCTLLSACNNLNYRTVWETTIPNNNVPYQSAQAKCNAIGQAARIKAESEYRATQEIAGTEIKGGFAGGFADSLNRGRFARNMGEAAFISCMAENNYVSRRVQVNR